MALLVTGVWDSGNPGWLIPEKGLELCLANQRALSCRKFHNETGRRETQMQAGPPTLYPPIVGRVLSLEGRGVSLCICVEVVGEG